MWPELVDGPSTGSGRIGLCALLNCSLRSLRIALDLRPLRRHSPTKSVSARFSSARRRAIRDLGNSQSATVPFPDVTPLEAAVLVPMLLPSWMDPEYLINFFGPYALWGVAFIIFAECGLFAILPGDSLLFTVGLLTATGVIPYNLAFVCVVLTIAAVLGNVSGYAIGRKIGPPLFKPRPGLAGRIFKQSYVVRTHLFFERYGNRALILARFVPIVRTFVTLVAGVGKMDFRHFITYTAIGGVLWACGLTIAGYFLGNIPFIKNNIEAVVILIVIASLVPMGVEYLLHRRRRKHESAAV
jgi:membrane-associated protein